MIYNIMLIAFIMLIWSTLGGIVLVLIPYTREAYSLKDIFNPKAIYDNLFVNWFGCFLLTVLFNFLCPLMSIGYWIYFLATVGRKH